MSSCLVVQTKDLVYIGADTAISLKDGNEFTRTQRHESKIYRFDNGLIFCSGNLFYVRKIIAFIKNNGFIIDPEKISSFVKNTIKEKNKDIFQVEIVCCLVENESVNIYQISEYNDFDVLYYDYIGGDTRVLAYGLHTEKCFNKAHEEILKKVVIENVFLNTFNHISCEQIGGEIELWRLNKNDALKIYSRKIEEKNNYLIYNYDEKKLHSVVGDALVGRVIAGNQLTLTNENNTFVVDGTGATLTDATFSILKNNSKIVMNPDEGISISKRVEDTWEKNFYIDTYGNLVFAGNLSGASGTFTGSIEASSGKIGAWTIDAYGLKDDSGNYIYGDGRVRLGALEINGSNATFYGNIYANNLQGYVYGEQLRNINADYIDAGTIRGVDIYGTNIYGSNIEWAGVSMTSSGFGISLLNTENTLILRNDNGAFSEINLGSSGISLQSLGGIVKIGSDMEPSTSNLFLYGNIYTNGKKGMTGTFLV